MTITSAALSRVTFMWKHSSANPYNIPVPVSYIVRCQDFFRLMKQEPTTLPSLPFGLIVNTDPTHRTGRHWVAFFVEEMDTVECYDAYGASPADYYIHLKLPMK